MGVWGWVVVRQGGRRSAPPESERKEIAIICNVFSPPSAVR